jgi:hypothetical protein
MMHGRAGAIDDQSAGMRFDCAANLGHRALSIQTRPPFTGIFVADGSLTNFGTRGARGFHFAPLPVATSSAKRAAIVAGVSVLR